jgi:hypothetical protein
MQDEIYAFCQFCKEKREMIKEYVISTGTVRTLRGKCTVCNKSVQLVVPKDFKI